MAGLHLLLRLEADMHMRCRLMDAPASLLLSPAVLPKPVLHALLTGGFRVIVLLPRQKVASIDAPEDSVWSLKEAIYDYYGLYPEKQRLIYADQVLENEWMLSDYGIQDGSEVKMVVDCSTQTSNKLVKVKTLQGETIQVPADASATIDEVKRLVSERTGLAPSNYALRWQEWFVAGGQTLMSLCPRSRVIKLSMKDNTEAKLFNKHCRRTNFTQQRQ